MTTPANQFEVAFVRACLLELQAIKPGNVGAHGASDNELSQQKFIDSAHAAAAPVCAAGASVGQRVLQAIQATRAVVDTNTNLGIVLLAAPILLAAEQADAATPLHQALTRVLQALTIEDAQLVYRAIRLAEPGGMGSSADQDIADEPTVSLLVAMQHARDRDQIARQYCDGFALIFDTALPRFRSLLGANATANANATVPVAISRTFIELLALQPDTLIIRRHGLDKARKVSADAGKWNDQIIREGYSPALQQGLLQWDKDLKAQGLNPGTTADIIVATLLVEELVRTEEDL